MSRRKSYKKDTHHEYISTKQYKHGFWFRLSNYFVLLSMVAIDVFFQKNDIGFQFPESVYFLVFSAIVGYDIPMMIDKIKELVRKKKK